jgi:hypothetical protein
VERDREMKRPIRQRRKHKMRKSLHDLEANLLRLSTSTIKANGYRSKMTAVLFQAMPTQLNAGPTLNQPTWMQKTPQ